MLRVYCHKKHYTVSITIRFIKKLLIVSCFEIGDFRIAVNEQMYHDAIFAGSGFSLNGSQINNPERLKAPI